MSKITVQDIEAVDDYWGPTFRSILEGMLRNSLRIQQSNLHAQFLFIIYKIYLNFFKS